MAVGSLTRLPYAASKGALATTVKYFAKELGPHGVRVNGVFMGWMWGAPVQGYIRQTAADQHVPEQQLIDQIADASLDANGGEFMA